MEVILAKSAGFCFGVDRAVRMAQELADTSSSPLMLGTVIHNTHVVEELASQGMRVIESPDEAASAKCILPSVRTS